MNIDLIHGGAIDAMRAAYPNAPQPWIDLSTGINPWPYEDLSVSEAALIHLPTQTSYAACRNAMATAIGANADALILAPGSELLIRLLPDIIKAQRVAILDPTYGDHAEVWTRAGAEVIRTHDPLTLAASVDAVVITHPNNPDGRTFSLDALHEARQTLAARGGWLIIDEAYADLTPSDSFTSYGGEEGLIILRSFGKFFGLAGVRLGGLLAPQAVREAFSDRLGIWPVSGMALAIGERAYADLEWQTKMRAKLKTAAQQLDDMLTSQGLKVVGGTDLYRLVEVHDAPRLFERLAKAGIYVRRFAWSHKHLRLGLPPSLEAEARLKSVLNLSK
ncbi:MAG: threonine-phosphate decarboxylase CobD [Pseudomonadota bacterium]